MKWPWSALVAFFASYLRWICLRLALLGARYVSLSRAILLLLGAEIQESIRSPRRSLSPLPLRPRRGAGGPSRWRPCGPCIVSSATPVAPPSFCPAKAPVAPTMPAGLWLLASPFWRRNLGKQHAGLTPNTTDPTDPLITIVKW